MEKKWVERDLSSASVREHELTSSDGEFMRVASDDETVAISWSTNLSVGGLLRTIADRQKMSRTYDAVVVDDAGAKERIPTSFALEKLTADAGSVVSARIPFEGFSVTWTRADRPGRPRRKFAAAAITYARHNNAVADGGTAILRATGTPLVGHSELRVRDTLHEFEVI